MSGTIFPHVILTSELEWDSSVLDHDSKEDEQWGEVPELDSSFDEVGDYNTLYSALGIFPPPRRLPN
jgi:hypothetical protein